ncbi:MAG: phosphopentomutase [Acidobacteriota bacterium]
MVRRVTIDRVILIVLDSLGAGTTSNASDEERHAGVPTSRPANGLRLPNLERLGLGNVSTIEGVAKVGSPQAACGRLCRHSVGRDPTTGYWELAGLEVDQPFATFPNGFPRDLIEAFEGHTGRGVLGNRQASGQEMLDECAAEHMESGHWIVYTSPQSVLQLAAHEDLISREELADSCRLAQRLATRHRLGCVIARPFKGPRQGQYEFTSRRREYPLPPPRPTVLDSLTAQGLPVVGIGRISDFFAGRGVVEQINSQGNTDGMIKTVEAMARLDRGLFMIHLDRIDTRLGKPSAHRGHERFLEEFDVQLAMLLSRSSDTDLLLITAHQASPAGAAPPAAAERVPILAAGPAKAAGINLGNRRSFADVGATIAEIFGVAAPPAGESFLEDIA